MASLEKEVSANILLRGELMVAVCNDDTVLVMVCPVAYIWCTFVDGKDYVFSNYTSSLLSKKYPFLIKEATFRLH